MKKIIILFCLISFVFSIEYDFIINEKISDNFITIEDQNSVGNWNLIVNTNSSNRAIISDQKSFVSKDGECPLISSDDNEFFTPSINNFPFEINVDLTSFKNIQKIYKIKLFVNLEDDRNKNFKYSFTGDCEINGISAFADIKYKTSKSKNQLDVLNIEEIQEFYVDPLCFNDAPRKNAKTYNLTFKNQSSSKTNINLFSECGEGSQKYIYDFSDYPDHGGRKINLKPNNNYTFKIDEASWKKLKYRFTNNKKTLKDGQYIDLNINQIKKKKSVEITINDDLIKEYFGSKESYTLSSNDFNLKNENDLTYVLDKSRRNPKDNSEYGIKGSKISFPTGNIKDIRHLTVNGIPAVIDEKNKLIKKAVNPVLIIVDFNGIKNSDAKNGEEFLGIIREIFNLTKNSNYHIFKYINQYPYENNEDYIFGSTELTASNFGLNKIYLLDFDESDGSITNFKTNQTVSHPLFPYIDEQNYVSFHDYMNQKNISISKIKKRGIWSFEPILSYESLNFTGTTSDVNEKIGLSSYLNTFRNTVLNTDEGDNSILPSYGPSQFKKIYYISFNEPTKKVDFQKDYNINFISYKNYKEILK